MDDMWDIDDMEQNDTVGGAEGNDIDNLEEAFCFMAITGADSDSSCSSITAETLKSGGPKVAAVIIHLALNYKDKEIFTRKEIVDLGLGFTAASVTTAVNVLRDSQLIQVVAKNGNTQVLRYSTP